MMNRSSAIGRRLRLIVLALLVGGATFALVYLVGTWGAFQPGAKHAPAERDMALPGTDAEGVALYSYAGVDPALIPALEVPPGYDQPDPLYMIAAGIPPIGIYLPSTGDTQFELPQPTLTPVLTPLSTPPPPATGEAPAELGIITPAPATFVGPDGVVGPPPETYGGESCAPAGWPAPGVLTQYYHWYHGAIDIGTPLGTPVVATHSGEVIFAGWRTDGYGYLIILQNGPFITYYAHLNAFNVQQGQRVGRNSVIGWSGSTGNSTGPHVHYEIRINDVEVDPLTFENRGYATC